MVVEDPFVDYKVVGVEGHPSLVRMIVVVVDLVEDRLVDLNVVALDADSGHNYLDTCVVVAVEIAIVS